MIHRFKKGNTFGRLCAGISKGKGRKHPPDCKHCLAVRTGRNFFDFTAAARKWRLANPEKVRQSSAKYRAANRSMLQRKKAAEYLANSAHCKRLSRLWRKANPGKTASYRWARRLRTTQAAVGDTTSIFRWEQAWRLSSAVVCYWCNSVKRGSECHADHVIALVNGGAHALNNLVISCSTCNQRKRSMPIHQWLTKIGWAA